MAKLKIKKIETGKIKLFFLKSLGNILLLVVLFMLIDVALGGYFFWKYYSKIERNEIKIPLSLTINQRLIDNFINSTDQRQSAFKIADKENFIDLFAEK